MSLLVSRDLNAARRLFCLNSGRLIRCGRWFWEARTCSSNLRARLLQFSFAATEPESQPSDEHAEHDDGNQDHCRRLHSTPIPRASKRAGIKTIAAPHFHVRLSPLMALSRGMKTATSTAASRRNSPIILAALSFSGFITGEGSG